MYKKLVIVANKIVEIATIREENQPERIISLSDLSLSDFDDTYDTQLTELIMALEYDEVMALQAIMYLGRDKDYNPKLTPDEIFIDYKRYIESLGNNEKELAANQMIEKVPLGRYLTEGYAILGITL